MPDIPRPMKAVAGDLPSGAGWRYELKWDGMRALVGVEGERVRLRTANGRDATAGFPELAALGPGLAVGSAVLDGELVAFDASGRPDFGRLQSRMHVTDPRVAAERAARVPCVLVVFDLLELDGRALLDLPWSDRRHLLEALVSPGSHWRVPEVHDDGAALLEAAGAAGLEGVVAKRADAPYRPGTRTRDWVKVKVRRRQEAVVGGWVPGTGGRAERIGGLLVGHHDGVGGPLRYAGRVGSGLTDAELGTLAGMLARLRSDRCPFDPPPPPLQAAGALWVRPELVVEVAFAEWTGDGRMRHPVYAGRRTDVDPDEVTFAP